MVKEVGQDKLKEILAKHEAVFDGKLRKVEGTYVTLSVVPEAKPRYFKPRSVPYILKKKIDDELGGLERKGTIPSWIFWMGYTNSTHFKSRSVCVFMSIIKWL